MKILCFAALFIFFSNPTQAQTNTKWLKSTQNAELWLNYSYHTEIDYSNKPARTDFASEIDITVKLKESKTNSKIRVVLTSNGTSTNTCGRAPQSYKQEYFLDLTYEESEGLYKARFSRDAKFVSSSGVITKVSPSKGELMLRHFGYCNTIYYSFDLSFVVDGVWQIDPVNNSTDFRPEL